MKLLLSFACITFCSQLHTLSPDTCFAKSLPNGIQEITLPGKKLYGLFTWHLSGDEHGKIQMIFLANTFSEEALADDLRVFLNKNIEKAKRERENVSALLDLLNSKLDIQWIGIEASRKEMEDSRATKDILENYHKIKYFLLRKKMLDPEEIENLLHLSFSQEIIALAKYPELFHSKEFFIPLDDDSYKEEAISIAENIRHIKELVNYRLRQLFNAQLQSTKASCQDQKCMDNAVTEFNNSIRSQMTSVSALMESDTIISQERIRDALNEIRDEQLRELVSRFFVHFNQFLEHHVQRDRAVVLLALKQPGNGLITMGNKHQNGIIENLISSCSP